MPAHNVMEEIADASREGRALDTPGSAGIKADRIIGSTEATDISFGELAQESLILTELIVRVPTGRRLELRDCATLAAAGSDQSGAAAIATHVTFVTASDGAKGVVLPTATTGKLYFIYNTINANLLVYPATSDDINDGTVNEPVVIVGKGIGIFLAVDSVTWSSVGARVHAAVTATTGGGTTGLIPENAEFVTVTSDSADKQISLPAASVGKRIRILVGATGCELISAVAADKVNDVTVGATNEAALTATSMYDCQYLATNTWVVIGYTKLGAVQAALVPDAL